MRQQRDRSAGVVVFYRAADGCRFLLLLSRLTRRPLWEFPKGGVDRGESLLEAALRELEEETGFTPTDIRLVDGFERAERYRFTINSDEGPSLVHKRVTYFLAEAAHQEVRLSSSEASRHEWLLLPDALRRVRYPERRRLLEDAARAAGCTD